MNGGEEHLNNLWGQPAAINSPARSEEAPQIRFFISTSNEKPQLLNNLNSVRNIATQQDPTALLLDSQSAPSIRQSILRHRLAKRAFHFLGRFAECADSIVCSQIVDLFAYIVEKRQPLLPAGNEPRM